MWKLVLLVVVSLSQHAQCDTDATPTEQSEAAPAEQLAPTMVNQFSRNWNISGKDVSVLHNRRWAFQREFTFVALDASERFCQIYQVDTTDSSATDTKVCKFEFSVDPGEKVILDRITTYSAGGESVSLMWTTERMKRNGYMRSSTINVAECSRRSQAPETPGSEASKAPQNSSMPQYPTEDIPFESTLDILRRMNFTWVGGIEPVEMNSTNGVFFLGQTSENDSKVNAMYMDMATNHTEVLASLENFSLGKGDSRTSRAHNKFGQCFLDNTRKMFCSQQQLWDGHPAMSIFQESIDLPDTIDWFSMTNLREPALILVSGRCYRGQCKSFAVRKVADRSKKTLFSIYKLDVQCDNPSVLSMEIADSIKDSMFCFHLVCTNKSSDGVTVQYRRYCVKRDLITSWG